MPLKISQIIPNSLSSRSKLKAGHEILSVNGVAVHDILDLLFMTGSSSFKIEYQDHDKKNQTLKIINTYDKPLGIEVDLPPCRSCINNCIFCFVDQMPSGLRESLYVKDDDYIYSFFYGNFITLTNLSESEIAKICRQKISPLYISVHTTDSQLHKSILRYEIEFNILDLLRRLSESGIVMHTQIVLLPGINDSVHLEKTIKDLLSLPMVESIGIVPVGLTRYREGLVALEQVSLPINLPNIDKRVYLSDEFYLKSGLDIPKSSHYEDYVQIENGIGMIRKSLDNWKRNRKKFLKKINNRDGYPVFVTSVSGRYVIRHIVEDIKDKKYRILVVMNEFFGNSVTVTGLLTWEDIRKQLGLTENEYPVFSSAIFNHEDVTLDGYSVEDIRSELSMDVLVINELFI